MAALLQLEYYLTSFLDNVRPNYLSHLYDIYIEVKRRTTTQFSWDEKGLLPAVVAWQTSSRANKRLLNQLNMFLAPGYNRALERFGDAVDLGNINEPRREDDTYDYSPYHTW